MSIELLPPDKTYPATYHVRPNHCTCHPETCCCNDWAVYAPNGTKVATFYYKTVAKGHAEWLNLNAFGSKQP